MHYFYSRIIIALYFERYIFLMTHDDENRFFLCFFRVDNVFPQISRLSFAVNAARMHEPTKCMRIN